MYKIELPTQEGTQPFSGVRYGLLFIMGVAETEDEYLGKRLGAKRGFVATKVKSEAEIEAAAKKAADKEAKAKAAAEAKAAKDK